MIYLYKKVNKTKNNTYGFTEVKGVKELNKPFLLCLSGSDKYDKSIFGILRAGVQLARGYTTKGMAAGFSLDSMPIDFLGISFKKDEKYSDNYDEIAERLLLPFLLKEGDSPKRVIKQARRINFLTYDKGAIEYRNIEVKLKSLLIKNGFTKEDTIEILTQIVVVALGTDSDLDEVRATCTIFNDVNDVEITTTLADKYRRVLEKNHASLMYLTYGKYNSIYFSFLGTGEHSLKAYLSDSCIAKPAFSALVANALEISLQNERVKNIVRMNIDVTLKVLYYYAVENAKTEELLAILDSRLSYGNAYKYSLSEASLRKQLDDSYRLLRKTRKSLEKENSEEVLRNDKFNNLIKNIRKYCSDTTYYQILASSGLWAKKDYLDLESDREIRKKYDKLPKSVKEKTPKKKTTKKKTTTKKTTTKKTSD